MITFFKNNNGLIPATALEPNTWVNVVTPTLVDRDYLLNELHIPEAFYNDIEDIDERPRIEMEDGWYLFLLRIPIKTNDVKLPFNTAPLGIVFKDDVFVSISFHPTDILTDFVRYTERKGVIVQNHFEFVLRLVLSSSIWYMKYLKQINQLIKLAENNLEKSIRNEDLQTLLQIEKCLVYFMTSLKGNDSLFHRMKGLKAEILKADPDLLEDVAIELRQAHEMAGIYSNILSGMMDAYASVISNNLNVIMKRLTSISLILMIPTLIASLYGMNVPNSLEQNPMGLWIIILISVGLSGIGVLIFRKKHWF